MSLELQISFGKKAQENISNMFSFSRIVSGSNGALYYWDIFYGGIHCKKITPLFQNQELSHYCLNNAIHLFIERKNSQILCLFHSHPALDSSRFFIRGYDIIIEKAARKHLFLQYKQEKYTINFPQDVPEKEDIRRQMQKIYTPEEDNCWKTPGSWNDNVLTEKMKKYDED